MSKKLLEFPIPSVDASIEEWTEFAENASWRVIRTVQEGFSPRCSATQREHDLEIARLIGKRLLSFEFPVLNKKFMSEHSDRILLVDENASHHDIKDALFHHHIMELRPKYVVERSGQFRGFALSDDFLLAGVTAGCATAKYVGENSQQLGARLLTNDESVLVEVNLEYLVDMMTAINVPNIKDMSYWMLDPLQSRYEGLYRTYDLSHSNRKSYIEASDMVHILAKL